jgi:hypothetical protein
LAASQQAVSLPKLTVRTVCIGGLSKAKKQQAEHYKNNHPIERLNAKLHDLRQNKK